MWIRHDPRCRVPLLSVAGGPSTVPNRRGNRSARRVLGHVRAYAGDPRATRRIVLRRHAVGTRGDARAARHGEAAAQAEFGPAGYRIGINDGAAAGQTIGHLQMHLIPRYAGDSPDPRGGVRWAIADKADYWTVRDEAQPT